MILLILITLVLSLSVYLLVKWITKNNDYFEKRGIKYEKPFPLIGNSSYMLRGDFIRGVEKQYYKFPNEKVVGTFLFMKPGFLLRSPDVIKQLTVKDFSHFQDHVTFISDKTDELFANVLFAMKGKPWRNMRSSLSPVFTGRKMRIMLDLIIKCGEQMCEYLNEDFEKNGPTIYPMKSFFSKYANDVIATVAFGVEVNSLKHPNNDIYQISEKMLGIKSASTLIIKFIGATFFPRLANVLNLKIFSDEIKNKFTKLIKHTMEVRERENIQRPDMLQLLMKLKEGQLYNEEEMADIDAENKMINGEVKKNWTDDELIAQCFQFFLGGFHTTSTALSFVAYALAVHADLQEKLIAEIDETQRNLKGEKLTYEVLMKMKYMDMFISEVLRMWPPFVASNRECTHTYTYEDEDLKFTIQKGDVLLIPMYTLHMDPKYFPNPQKFDPERFSDENRSNINLHAYLPFGVGPRNCIAFRFALMEVKAVIFQLLMNFRITPCKETEIPVEIMMSTLGLVAKNDIKLQFIPRKDKVTI